MSTKLDYAKESWLKAVRLAQSTADLASLIKNVRWVNGEQELSTVDECRYKIAASNSKGGRSLTVDRLIIDELCEHKDYTAWDAAEPTVSARPYGQIFCITNQGDVKSVVLQDMRANALRFLRTGEGDQRLGIFEWSAPDGADLLDPEAWCYANPNLGYRLDLDSLSGPAVRAAETGGQAEAGFRTQKLCQYVSALDNAIDPIAWAKSVVGGDLTQLRDRVALCLDISPDRMHATLCAAAVLPDERVRVEVVKDWKGPTTTDQLRRDLPGWLSTVKPKALGWVPNGPAATLAADLRDRKGVQGWPPRGVAVEEIRGEVAATCMGFADLVAQGKVIHAPNPLLDEQVIRAAKLRTGDTWRFNRSGDAMHVDAVYAAAGAVHLARTLPTSIGAPRILYAA